MKSFAMFAAAMLISGVALADNTGTNGEGKNCFGQGRSDYASTHTQMGQIISDRAQTPGANGYPNQNVELNAEYKAACQQPN